MSSEVENPPAFPSGWPEQGYEPGYGMSLRDYFATAALTGIGTWMPTTSHADLTLDWALQLRAEWAYRQADAMLAARTQEPTHDH